MTISKWRRDLSPLWALRSLGIQPSPPQGQHSLARPQPSPEFLESVLAP